MHGRHVSGNEHDQQPGRIQRLIKKQLLKQMCFFFFPKTNIKRISLFSRGVTSLSRSGVLTSHGANELCSVMPDAFYYNCSHCRFLHFFLFLFLRPVFMGLGLNFAPTTIWGYFYLCRIVTPGDELKRLSPNHSGLKFQERRRFVTNRTLQLK